MKELLIPDAALNDPDSFEILRVWAANNEQHVTIHSGLNGDASDFGYMLAQLAMHGSNLYSERMKTSPKEMLHEILNGFKNEIEDNTGNSTGAILK